MRVKAVTPRIVTIKAPTITVNGLRSAKLGMLAYLVKPDRDESDLSCEQTSSRDELNHRGRLSKGLVYARSGGSEARLAPSLILTRRHESLGRGTITAAGLCGLILV